MNSYICIIFILGIDEREMNMNKQAIKNKSKVEILSLIKDGGFKDKNIFITKFLDSIVSIEVKIDQSKHLDSLRGLQDKIGKDYCELINKATYYPGLVRASLFIRTDMKA